MIDLFALFSQVQGYTHYNDHHRHHQYLLDHDQGGFTQFEYDNHVFEAAELVIGILLFIGFGILCLCIGYLCGYGTKPCIKKVVEAINRKIDERKEKEQNRIDHPI